MNFFLLFLVEFIVLFFVSRNFTRSLSFLPITLISFIFLPGIIIHELSHLLVASILFVKTGEIEFMPQRHEGELKLGSVSIGQTDPVRRFLIGVSPIIGGLGIIFVIFQFASLSTTGILIKVLLSYVLFTIGNTMFSSKKDLEGAITLLLVILIISIAFFVMGFRIQSSWFDGNSFLSFTDNIKQADLYLGFLIGIDVLAYLIVKKLRG